VKVSLNWLKEYVALDGISVKEISNKLTMSGLEVEDIVEQNEIYKNFVVGYVKDTKEHPNADKLSLCTVSTGTEDFEVICGAPNVEKGQKVVFAKIGAIIPKGKSQLGKAKIRGIESFGMLCSEAELELSDSREKIMVLDKHLKEGTPITEALSLNDVIMEISITPNRADALSHIGVARDLAVLLKCKLKIPRIKFSKSSIPRNEQVSVKILDTGNCPRYVAKVVKNITVKDSPEWLKSKLIAIGLRPINNVVDTTNFVMYETGQPLHAFDLKKLRGREIIVKSTSEESVFKTLDSKNRKLPAGTLMICDADKSIAIAGVMGGENSEISNQTVDIVIESAYFNPSSIRRTSKILGLSTEASYRFERGCDPNNALYAAQRAAQIICELSGGEVAEGEVDVYPQKINECEVRLRINRVNKLLGYDIEKKKILYILIGLGFKITFESDDELHLKVPTYRPDVEREADVIEEIARINGYDNIPTIEKISITLDRKHDESEFAGKVRNIAAGLGFYEMINNPLQSEKTASLIGNKINVLNPQSNDMAFLRTSLIPGALITVSKNIKAGEKNLVLFEIGNVFNNVGEKEIKSYDDFVELQKLIFLLTGKLNEKQWNYDEKLCDFYYLKGIINNFIIKISLDNVLNDSYYVSANSLFDFSFNKNYKNSVVGESGRIKRDILRQFDIHQDVFCCEFNLDLLKKIKPKEKIYKEPLKFPKVNRDFAFIFDKQVLFDDVVGFIWKSGSRLLQNVNLFDVFESESLGINKKSMAFSLQYYSEERTLTEEEVEKDFNNLISLISKRFNAKLRG